MKRTAEGHTEDMWKMLAVLAMLFSVCTVAGCEVQDMGSLSDLSKPYTGVYE